MQAEPAAPEHTTPPRHWSGHVYYYTASLVGLSLVLFGAVGVMRGLLQAAVPTAAPEFRYSQEIYPERLEPPSTSPQPTLSPTERRRQVAVDRIRAEGLFRAVEGLSLAVVGAPVFVWHIRRARRREADQ